MVSMSRNLLLFCSKLWGEKNVNRKFQTLKGKRKKKEERIQHYIISFSILSLDTQTQESIDFIAFWKDAQHIFRIIKPI